MCKITIDTIVINGVDNGLGIFRLKRSLKSLLLKWEVTIRVTSELWLSETCDSLLSYFLACRGEG